MTINTFDAVKPDGMIDLPIVESPLSTDRRPLVSRAEWMQTGVAAALALTAEVVALSTGAEDSVPVMVLAAAAIALGGREMLVNGWRAVRALSLGINFLMTVAVAGALFIGEWPEAAMVVVLFALAERIEAYALDRSRGAIRDLLKLAPDTVRIQSATGDWIEIGAASVLVGQVFRVRPGDRVPLDGRVMDGRSSVNQAPITGESMPVEKKPGDEVFAGTINERGVLDIEVTHAKLDTTLARIIRAVQQAQADRGRTQRFVDRFARVYTPVVVVLAVLIAVVPPIVFASPFYAWLYRALVLLVIACPCALVISTPVTVVSGLAAAARRGILVKGGAYLENGHRIRVVALDKTGTITEGRPRLTDVIPLQEGLSEAAALRLAAALDAPSEHPVAAAIVEAFNQGAPGSVLVPVDGFQALVGRGVHGRIDGNPHYLGNQRLIDETGLGSPQLAAALARLEQQGKTAVALVAEQGPMAAFGVADSVRSTSVEALRQLREIGVRAVMLTGDNQVTADAIAREVGIDDARGALLPEDKMAAVGSLRLRYGPVGMVGDGINDAPALASADIGFAMGAAGTDTAIETADVALMKDDLRKLPEFLRLSRRASRVLWQNITFALVVKAAFFALAVAGSATLWMAVFADLGASLIVTFNGLRLLRTLI